MSILTVAISTVEKNLDVLLERLRLLRYKLPLTVRFLVVSQLESEDAYFDFHGIDVYLSTEKGLSKSRNFALRKCVTDWIWFQDDDIELIFDRFLALLDNIKDFDSDLLLVKVASREQPDEGFKNYDRYAVNKTLLAFRISSIEIFAKVGFLRKNNIKFDENLGLGSSLPSCEENLFFYDCVTRSSGKYQFYNEAVCLHTTINESRNIDYLSRYRARGYMLAKIGTALAPVILVWWAVRGSSDGIPRWRKFFLMSNTFLRALRYRH